MPAPRTSTALTLKELEQAIRRSWAADTTDDPDEWSPANPARGQCGVTALTVRDLLGDDILIADVFAVVVPRCNCPALNNVINEIGGPVDGSQADVRHSEPGRDQASASQVEHIWRAGRAVRLVRRSAISVATANATTNSE